MVYTNDNANYSQTYYEWSVPVSQSQYQNIRAFAEDARVNGSFGDYDGLTNSCIDFTFRALQVGEVLPPSLRYDSNAQVWPTHNVSAINKVLSEYLGVNPNAVRQIIAPEGNLNLAPPGSLPSPDTRAALERIQAGETPTGEPMGQWIDNTPGHPDFGQHLWTQDAEGNAIYIYRNGNTIVEQRYSRETGEIDYVGVSDTRTGQTNVIRDQRVPVADAAAHPVTFTTPDGREGTAWVSPGRVAEVIDETTGQTYLVSMDGSVRTVGENGEILPAAYTAPGANDALHVDDWAGSVAQTIARDPDQPRTDNDDAGSWNAALYDGPTAPPPDNGAGGIEPTLSSEQWNAAAGGLL
jgi:hypothetical protein